MPHFPLVRLDVRFYNASMLARRFYTLFSSLLLTVCLPSCGDDGHESRGDEAKAGTTAPHSPAAPTTGREVDLRHNGRAQYEKAGEWAQKAAEGTEGAFEKAVEWTRKAAENGYCEAQLTLAALYFYGHEQFPRDAAKARQWFLKAAQQGSAEAHYYLGVLYALGEGVEKDVEKSKQELSVAARAGVAEAQYQIGILFIENESTLEEGLDWLRQAAEHAQVDAALALGKIYARGKYSLEPDMREAARWYHRAAQGGNAQAQYVYALMCLTGSGVERNDKQGMSWLQLAAGRDYLPAVEKLAECYRKGEGTPVDDRLADVWAQRAAELEAAARQPEKRRE